MISREREQVLIPHIIPIQNIQRIFRQFRSVDHYRKIIFFQCNALRGVFCFYFDRTAEQCTISAAFGIFGVDITRSGKSYPQIAHVDPLAK